MNTPIDAAPVPLSVALPVWIRVALLSFGGPAGQIAVLHRLIVEERRWVSESRFLHCMSYCMLLPGPEATQLATYLGWLLHGTRGGLVAGALFIAPGFVSILMLSLLYAEYRDTTLLQGLFYGLKPAVIAVVLEALVRIGRRALTGSAHRLIAALAFIAMFFLAVPFPIVIVLAALAGAVFLRASRLEGGATPAIEHATITLGRPTAARAARTVALWLAVWFAPVAVVAALFGGSSIFVEEALFFSRAAVLTFGGAYAILTYIAEQVVHVFGWLSAGEMLDGLGMAETTPGPLIQVVQFVGYIAAYRDPGALSPVAAGVLGSIVTAWVTFIPSFLFVFAGAPYAEALRERRGLQAALAGVTAAIVGVILQLAVWFALHVMFDAVAVTHVGPLRLYVPAWGTLDLFAVMLAACAAVALMRLQIGMPLALAAAALLGLAWRLWRG